MIAKSKMIRDLASEGWRMPKGPKRAALVASTKWELQTLGAIVELLKRRSRMWTLRRSDRQIDLSVEMQQFRDAITLGDFDDELRAADAAEARNAELAADQFAATIMLPLYRWG